MTTRPGIRPEALPHEALLRRYVQPGSYADCLVIDMPSAVSIERLVEAFLTSRAFRAERLLLALVLRMPSTDADAAEVASGRTDRFAAWTIEARQDRQVLLCDFQRRTRTWLMVEPLGDTTRLRFGTAVVAATGLPFRLLTPVHKVYARILLRSTVRRLGQV